MQQAASLNLPTDVLRRNALPSLTGMSIAMSRYVNRRTAPRTSPAAAKTLAQRWIKFFIDGGYWYPGTGTINGRIPDTATLPSNKVVIPSAIGGISVVALGDNVPAHATTDYGMFRTLPITSISIPNTITVIGYRPASGCINLSAITIPKSVTSIGTSAFHGCESLATVTFDPDSALESIGEQAFRGCDDLIAVTIPKTVKLIETGAFNSCGLLATVTFEPDSLLESIGDEAFRNCDTLLVITIPESLTTPFQTSIGDSAFRGCEDLHTVTIPDTIESIKTEAFRACASLSSITFEGTPTLTELEDDIFKGVSGSAKIYVTDVSAFNTMLTPFASQTADWPDREAIPP